MYHLEQAHPEPCDNLAVPGAPIPLWISLFATIRRALGAEPSRMSDLWSVRLAVRPSVREHPVAGLVKGAGCQAPRLASPLSLRLKYCRGIENPGESLTRRLVKQPVTHRTVGPCLPPLSRVEPYQALIPQLCPCRQGWVGGEMSASFESSAALRTGLQP